MFEVVFELPGKVVIKRHATAPVMLTEHHANYDFVEDEPQVNKITSGILDQLTEPVIWIVDMSHMDIDMNQMVYGANQVARGVNPVWQHPNMKQMLTVIQSPMLKLGTKNMSDDVFGNLSASIFDTAESAVEYALSVC